MIKKIAKIIFIVLFILAVIWIFWKNSDKYTKEPKKVWIYQVKFMKEFETSSVWVTGTVEAKERREVFPEISGIVEKILLKEGDSVKKGQDVIILKNPEITKDLKEAENSLKEAEISLLKAREEVNLNIKQKEISLSEAENQLLQIRLEGENNEKKNVEAVEQAQWEVEETKKNYEKLVKEFNSRELQQELSIKEAEITKNEAEAEKKRREELFQAKIISQKLMEEAANRYEKAKLQYEYVLQEYEFLKETKAHELDLACLKIKECEYLLESLKERTETDKKLYRQKIEAAEENLKNSEETLSLAEGVNQGSLLNPALAEEKVLQGMEKVEMAGEGYLKTLIKSPIDGIITVMDEAVKAGKEVTTATRLMVVTDLKNLQIKARVNQGDITSVFPGQAVRISGGNSQLRGEVTSISPEGQAGEREDEKNITFEVIIAFKPEESAISSGLKPGMARDIEFISDCRENTMVVYSDSVIRKEDRAYVFLYDKGIARRVEIKTGISDMFATEILSGISGKDRVLGGWEGELCDGEAVEERED